MQFEECCGKKTCSSPTLAGDGERERPLPKPNAAGMPRNDAADVCERVVGRLASISWRRRLISVLSGQLRRLMFLSG